MSCIETEGYEDMELVQDIMVKTDNRKYLFEGYIVLKDEEYFELLENLFGFGEEYESYISDVCHPEPKMDSPLERRNFLDLKAEWTGLLCSR